MLIGIININKPLKMTSHDVVSKMRKILGIKKIGHGGTLDPLASGVLPICINKATRLTQYLPTDKQYIAEITLGITTSSYDSDGEITSKQDYKAISSIIIEELEKFKGKITQEVPLTSATHYQGQKLYKYAQKGIEITDLPTKEVTIYDITILDKIDEEKNNPTIKLKIDCSSGTYIRSIANDLGKNLKCGAYLSSLQRTLSSGLKIDNSYTLEEVEQIATEGNVESILVSPQSLISWPEHLIGFGQIERISKGQFFKLTKDSYINEQKVFLVNKESKLIAIGEYDQTEQIIKPKLVFT
ncbi:MAG: tRNA pseudouridine(55) synthase TruB [Vampirovibrionia bacterium]